MCARWSFGARIEDSTPAVAQDELEMAILDATSLSTIIRALAGCAGKWECEMSQPQQISRSKGARCTWDSPNSSRLRFFLACAESCTGVRVDFKPIPSSVCIQEQARRVIPSVIPSNRAGQFQEISEPG